jgi:hypothetical protein
MTFDQIQRDRFAHRSAVSLMKIGLMDVETVTSASRHYIENGACSACCSERGTTGGTVVAARQDAGGHDQVGGSSSEIGVFGRDGVAVSWVVRVAPSLSRRRL